LLPVVPTLVPRQASQRTPFFRPVQFFDHTGIAQEQRRFPVLHARFSMLVQGHWSFRIGRLMTKRQRD
jgi:hypothetical protein